MEIVILLTVFLVLYCGMLKLCNPKEVTSTEVKKELVTTALITGTVIKEASLIPYRALQDAWAKVQWDHKDT